MAIKVNNPEADALVRDAKEAIARRGEGETPLETAARLRKEYGISLTPAMRRSLPREAIDAMWCDS